MNIVTTEGKVAFTPEGCPATEGQEPASDEQMQAWAQGMNKRAEELGIKTRYEVK